MIASAIMASSSVRRTGIVILFFAALIGLWWLATASGRWSAVILPSPASVADYLWTGLLDGSILEATAVTMKRLLVGYFIGVAIGLPPSRRARSLSMKTAHWDGLTPRG